MKNQLSLSQNKIIFFLPFLKPLTLYLVNFFFICLQTTIILMKTSKRKLVIIVKFGYLSKWGNFWPSFIWKNSLTKMSCLFKKNKKIVFSNLMQTINREKMIFIISHHHFFFPFEKAKKNFKKSDPPNICCKILRNNICCKKIFLEFLWLIIFLVFYVFFFLESVSDKKGKV